MAFMDMDKKRDFFDAAHGWQNNIWISDTVSLSVLDQAKQVAEGHWELQATSSTRPSYDTLQKCHDAIDQIAEVLQNGSADGH